MAVVKMPSGQRWKNGVRADQGQEGQDPGIRVRRRSVVEEKESRRASR